MARFLALGAGVVGASADLPFLLHPDIGRELAGELVAQPDAQQK